jgi:hypothetical protein
VIPDEAMELKSKILNEATTRTGSVIFGQQGAEVIVVDIP